MRTLSATLLALQAVPLAGASSWDVEQLPLSQKWSWSDLDSLKEQVKDGISQHRQRWTEGIEDYKQSVKDYGEALRDNAFKRAVQATGICDRLPRAQEESAGEIEEQLPEDMTEMEEDAGENSQACEAVADEVTAEELQSRLEEGQTGDILNRFMKLITDRSSAALCEGQTGVKDWLDENSGLKDTDPEKYKEELRKQLRGRMNPILQRYSSQFCEDEEEGGDEEEGADAQRLFVTGSRPLVAAGGRGLGVAVPAMALFGVALLGLGAFAVRRSTRRPQAQELEPLAPEEVPEGGVAV
mmetsp:Transcript_15040/g.45014  ORF Transcript_15040/g.45014 Transcript_15040/m.45014 type:complete len:298 (+) Transcript_15040:81-974(+)